MPKYDPNKPWRKWYGLKIWQYGLQPKQLSDHPLCARCMRDGKYVEAKVVNHIIPHRGDWRLFISIDNLESLCKACHDSEVQSEERVGFSKRIGNDGWPVDERHPFNRKDD